MTENSNTMNALVINDVHAGYGPLEVLRGFTLNLGLGECVALIGPNGAGKSTLLELICGGLQPSEGSVAFEGESTHNTPAILRIAQEPDLPPFLSLLEMVVLGLRGWRQDINDPSLQAQKLLEKWGLSGRLDRPARLASPGEVRRTLFALVEGVRPRVLLLDEALSALDPAILVQAEDLLKTLANEGCSTLVVTHDMGLAERIPDRVALLHEGELFATWTRTEIAKSRTSGTSLLDLYLATTSNSKELSKELKNLP